MAMTARDHPIDRLAVAELGVARHDPAGPQVLRAVLAHGAPPCLSTTRAA